MNLNVCYSFMVPSSMSKLTQLTGKQLQNKLRTWLSPPDSSINYNNACKMQHTGTAMWFIQGSTFQDWKKNGSLLWIRGNRAFLLLTPLYSHLFLSDSPAGAGKSVLWYAIFLPFPWSKSHIVDQLCHYQRHKEHAKRAIRLGRISLL